MGGPDLTVDLWSPGSCFDGVDALGSDNIDTDLAESLSFEAGAEIAGVDTFRFGVTSSIVSAGPF